MVLAVLAARVDRPRKSGEKLLVKLHAGKRPVKRFRIDAGDDGLEAEFDERPGEFSRVSPPDGENCTHANLGQILLAAFPHVLEEDIADDHHVGASGLLPLEDLAHASFVLGIVCVLGNAHLLQGKAPIREAKDVLPFIQQIRDKRQEYFVCLSLNGANEVIESRVVTVGLLDSNQVHPREVFADPISDRAASVILAHNHPSGTLEASPEDLALTKRLVKAGEILGIKVLDHLIVTRNGHLSLKQTGNM